MNPNLRRRLKYVAPLVVKKVSFENLDRKYVGLEHIESWTGRILYDDLTTLPEGTVSLFEPNDVLFGKLRPYLAKVSLVDFSGACSTEALVLRPKTNQWPPFVRYVLSNGEFIDDVNSSTFGAKMPRASWEFIGSRTVPVPDLPTQKAIADFLDRETARIDQLIERKQRMVEVLGEKRQAVISHAVTKGLDPSVRMQESCVEWIGALPESSGVRRGKFMFREGNARSKTGGEELLSVSHVTGVTRRSEKNVYMFLAESNEDYKLVTTGDVVVNTMWAWMGAIGVSPIDGLISPSYGVYAPTGNHYVPQYLELLLRSRPFVAEVNRRSKGVWSSRLRLYPDAFLDISFPVPSREDQAKTLSALAYATKRESTLGELGARSIDRLREFRSALITAAVTGQIDVSTWGKQGTTDRRLDQIEEAASA